MNFIKNMRIGARLGVAFAILLLLLAAVATMGALRIGAINENVKMFSENIVPSLKAIEKLKGAAGDMRRIESQSLLQTSEKALDESEGRVTKARQTIDAQIKIYEPMVVDEKDRANLKAVQENAAAYDAVSAKLRPLIRKAVTDKAAADEARVLMFGDSRAAFNKLSESIDTIWAYNEVLAENTAKEAAEAYTRAVRFMIVAAVVATLLGVALAFLITRSITRPLSEAIDAAKRIGEGDLTSKIEVTSTDETGQLLASLKEMNEGLVKIVGRVRSSSDSIATGSAQIALGNADLSQRTEEQASNLQQTAASMEQITATVKQNSETARSATELSGSAANVAAHGGKLVGEVVSTMEQISASSRKISDIIGTIDGIAFQTNILALNAAVEAARAGEQGRGFAVVAGEVRNLAQRSAEAAKEIKNLIGESVERVEAGSTLVGEAGKTMADIVTQVKRVSEMIGEISAASVEQSSGITQVGGAVTQLDQVTQQNAALVEESAAAADSLKVQAAQLAEVVSTFKLGSTQLEFSAPAARPAAAPAKPKAAAAQAAIKSPPEARMPAPKAKAPAAAAPAPARATTSDTEEWTAF